MVGDVGMVVGVLGCVAVGEGTSARSLGGPSVEFLGDSLEGSGPTLSGCVGTSVTAGAVSGVSVFYGWLDV